MHVCSAMLVCVCLCVCVFVCVGWLHLHIAFMKHFDCWEERKTLQYGCNARAGTKKRMLLLTLVHASTYTMCACRLQFGSDPTQHLMWQVSRCNSECYKVWSMCII